MSDLYRLAIALKGASDSSLARLIHDRGLALADFRDFFDLAQAILTPKSQALLLSSCTQTQIRNLRALVSGEKIQRDQLGLLAQDFLIWSPSEPVVFDWLRERLIEQPRTLSIAVVRDENQRIDTESVDRDCGIRAFEAMQALSEMIFDFELNLARVVAKSAIGLPDVKRLSGHLGKSKEYVRAIFDLARFAGLVTADSGFFRPTEISLAWLDKSPKHRWQLVAETWVTMLGQAGAQELTLELANSKSAQLSNLLEACFPFGTQGNKVSKLLELADLIGLSAAGQQASWFQVALKSPSEAAKLISNRLPLEQERIIIQGDLSIVAPGPLPTKVEVELRKFAETESIGLASGYRISAVSISSGLEEGMSEKGIRDFLQTLSGSPLPQPVDYLIRETAARFGRIKIHNLGKSSRLEILDELLAKQMFMDSKLKGLLLTEVPSGLSSPIDSELLYHSLREAGYIAIRVDEAGKIIKPSSHFSKNSAAISFASQLNRLREADLQLSNEPVANDLERKIQLALRSKSSLQVEVSANGQIMSFLLEPIGIANGRLRARDRRADIERTLPVSAITSIQIG